jgi:hypothetical protein
MSEGMKRVCGGVVYGHLETVQLAEEAAEKRDRFREEIERLINRYSMENGSDTPDFILAEYLSQSLVLFDEITRKRERWHDLNNKSQCPHWDADEQECAD